MPKTLTEMAHVFGGQKPAWVRSAVQHPERASTLYHIDAGGMTASVEITDLEAMTKSADELTRLFFQRMGSDILAHIDQPAAPWKRHDPNEVTVTDESPEILQAAVEHVGQIVALRGQVEALEAQIDAARDALIGLLCPDGIEPGKSWKFKGLAEVNTVKGQTRRTLDRKILAAGGVDPALLDKATVESTGAASLRVTREE